MSDTEFRKLLIDVAEGNIGAASVLIKMLKASDLATDLILHLSVYGPRGSDLWVLYKDVHKENVEALMLDLVARKLEKHL